MHCLAKPQHLPATISSGMSECSPEWPSKKVSLVGEMPMLDQTPSDTINSPKTEVVRINFELQHGFQAFNKHLNRYLGCSAEVAMLFEVYSQTSWYTSVIPTKPWHGIQFCFSGSEIARGLKRSES